MCTWHVHLSKKNTKGNIKFTYTQNLAQNMLDILAVLLELIGNFLSRLGTSPGGNKPSS